MVRIGNADGRRLDARHDHERSAICPHLGCVVAWNALERRWDCPCHGSLFARDGSVLNGPANSSLACMILGRAVARR